jgi:hypothetical protein
MDKTKLYQEVAKIITDTPYALRTYLKTYDNTKKTFVPLELFDDQLKLIEDYENYNENITNKYRQAGVTTVTAGWISKKLQLASKDQPERILIIANKKDTSVEMANKIRGFLDQWPEWLNVGYDEGKNSESRYKLKNGSEVKAVASTKDALRGYTPTMLIFDEAAYIEAGEDFWTASMASLSTGGKVIVISCATKDTVVTTDKGLRKIEHFIDDSFKIGEAYTVDRYNILGNGKLRSSNLMMNNGKHKLRKITTTTATIKVTDNHKLWCFDKKTKSYGWKEAKDLNVSDKLLTFYNQQIFGDDDSLEDIAYYKDDEFKPTKINKALAYLLGLILFYGEYDKDYIRINTKHEISEVFEKLNIKDYYFEDNKVYIKSKNLQRVLDFIKLDISKWFDKREFPIKLLSLSKNATVSMVKAIYANAKMKRRKVYVEMYNENMMTQLRCIMGNLGYLMTVSKHSVLSDEKFTFKHKAKFNTKYSLFLTKYHTKKFLLTHKLPYHSIFTWAIKIRKGVFFISDYIHDTVSIIRKIYQKVKHIQNFDPRILFLIYEIVRKRKNTKVNRVIFSKIIKYCYNLRLDLGIDYEYIFTHMLYENSFWSNIRSIFSTEDYTYDFSLPNNKKDLFAHSVTYNGILGHQTPNGFDPIYYGVYDQALRGLNNFKITNLYWYNDPRYASDLKWIKCKDIVHYMLNKKDYNEDEVVKIEHERYKFPGLIKSGYKPYSSWFENMAKKFKFDRKKIAQEIECVVGDTIVTVKDKKNGKVKKIKIENLNKNYQVLSDSGFVDFDGIRITENKTIKIELENDKHLEGSYNHIIYTSNGEKTLDEIEIDDVILFKDNKTFKITNKIYNETPKKLYDVINSGENHRYYTNDILSHNCDFLGSGDTVIDGETIQKLLKNNVVEPERKLMNGTIWIWETPKAGHKYIMGVDVSRGDSEDFSSFTIIDFEERKQVVEFVGKIKPNELGELTYKFGLDYSAFIVVDITGGMGVSTVEKLQELGYKNLYIEGYNTLNKWEYNPKMEDKTPGLQFNNKRSHIISSFEEAIREGFDVKSLRLVNELNTFVYINGRPNHLKGAHDDSIMALAMAIYVGDNSFKQLKKAEESTKALIESWTVYENTTSIDSIIHSTPNNFDSLSNMGFGVNTNNQHTPQQYKEYSWLFGYNKFNK